MVEPVTVPRTLTRAVPVDYPAAVQGIAALEQRIIELRSWPGDFSLEAAAAHRLVVALREAFGIRELSEAEVDAAHEAAVVALDRLIEGESDVPVAYSPHRYPARIRDWSELELRSAHGDR